MQKILRKFLIKTLNKSIFFKAIALYARTIANSVHNVNFWIFSVSKCSTGFI